MFNGEDEQEAIDRLQGGGGGGGIEPRTGEIGRSWVDRAGAGEKGTRREKRWGERAAGCAWRERRGGHREKRAGGSRFRNSANAWVTNQTDHIGRFLFFFSLSYC